jgi:hypothetical protein
MSNVVSSSVDGYSIWQYIRWFVVARTIVPELLLVSIYFSKLVFCTHSVIFKMQDAEHRRGYFDESAIPGTVHLVDLEGTIRAKHASGAQLKDVVLVPPPSADLDDPLNWSPSRKRLSTASQSIYTLMVGIASAAIYSVLEPISVDTGLSLADLNAGTGYMFLFFVREFGSIASGQWLTHDRVGAVYFGKHWRCNTARGRCICSRCLQHW